MTPDADLLKRQRLDFFGHLPDWRQVIPNHAGASTVVVGRELGQQMIAMSSAKDDELGETFDLIV